MHQFGLLADNYNHHAIVKELNCHLESHVSDNSLQIFYLKEEVLVVILKDVEVPIDVLRYCLGYTVFT